MHWPEYIKICCGWARSADVIKYCFCWMEWPKSQTASVFVKQMWSSSFVRCTSHLGEQGEAGCPLEFFPASVQQTDVIKTGMCLMEWPHSQNMQYSLFRLIDPIGLMTFLSGMTCLQTTTKPVSEWVHVRGYMHTCLCAYTVPSFYGSFQNGRLINHWTIRKV